MKTFKKGQMVRVPADKWLGCKAEPARVVTPPDRDGIMVVMQTTSINGEPGEFEVLVENGRITGTVVGPPRRDGRKVFSK